MKFKWYRVVFIFAALLAMFSMSIADAAVQHFTATVYRYDQNKHFGLSSLSGSDEAKTNIMYKVLQYNSTTAETLYSSSGWSYGSSKTNPVTTTVYATDGGKIDFWCDPTETGDTYVDLVVVDATGGYTAVVKGLTKNQHAVYIDETPNKVHHGMIWFAGTTTDETSTGITLPYRSIVHDVRVEVVTVASAATIDVGILSSGTGGDADGFIKARLLTTAGFPKDTGVITAGTTLDYIPATTYGALLYTAITGSDAVASGGGRSYLGYVHDGTSTGLITYSQGSTTAKGYIHFWFTRMH